MAVDGRNLVVPTLELSVTVKVTPVLNPDRRIGLVLPVTALPLDGVTVNSGLDAVPPFNDPAVKVTAAEVVLVAAAVTAVNITEGGIPLTAVPALVLSVTVKE